MERAVKNGAARGGRLVWVVAFSLALTTAGASAACATRAESQVRAVATRHATMMSHENTGSRAAMVHIPSGGFQPLYAAASHRTMVAALSMDRYPVTRAAFAQFVAEHAEWRRSAVHTPGYLADWKSDAQYGDATDADRPVTNVTQTAAAAYCRTQGKRLPTVDEWEYAAAASETQRDGSKDPAFRQTLMDAYTRARPARTAHVGSGFTNAYGVSDMHGIVWEWTQENPDMQMDMSKHAHDMSCAGSAAGASDPTNFAAFLRYAYRSGLHATSTAPNLGFRCAGA